MTEPTTPPAPPPTPAAATTGRPTGAELRRLKGQAQRISTVTRMGRAGLSPAFVASVNHELANHELVKVKFTEFKDQRHELAAQLAAATASHLICVIGHVAVLYRRPAEADASQPSPQ